MRLQEHRGEVELDSFASDPDLDSEGENGIDYPDLPASPHSLGRPVEARACSGSQLQRFHHRPWMTEWMKETRFGCEGRTAILT